MVMECRNEHYADAQGKQRMSDGRRERQSEVEREREGDCKDKERAVCYLLMG